MMIMQVEVYQRVGRGLVDSVMQGFNAAVIAYGMTGSGKTYTMLGAEDAMLQSGRGRGGGAEGAALDRGLGLVPRLALDLFARAAAAAREGSEVSYVIRCSFLEIYMERVRDLLAVRETAVITEAPCLRLTSDCQ
jgi:primosomal protein N'